MSTTLVSIIINNYNYGRFVEEAIQSALSQSWPAMEVVVVDDGSSDNSVEVITRYTGRLIIVLKRNAGQGSAFNAGLVKSSGEIVIFLDSDDVLFSNAAEQVVSLFGDSRVVRVYWPMTIINEHGITTGKFSNSDLSIGDLSGEVLAGGPYMYKWGPTSGNAWRRFFLEAVAPIPEDAFTNYADNYLSALSPLYGLHASAQSLSCYRSHSLNETKQASHRTAFMERLQTWVRRFDICLQATAEHAARLGLTFDERTWIANSWFHRMSRAATAIISDVPADESVGLIDEDTWDTNGELAGRPVIPVIERAGVFWGRPADDSQAVIALETLGSRGVRYLAVAWTCFWWLDAYPALRHWLATHARQLTVSPDVMVFKLSDRVSP